MAKGSVKWYNSKKGFGFILPETGGKDIFLHVSGLHKDLQPQGPKEGAKVSYELGQDRDGREIAENVALA